jgi:hypothetical protein
MGQMLSLGELSADYLRDGQIHRVDMIGKTCQGQEGYDLTCPLVFSLHPSLWTLDPMRAAHASHLVPGLE